MTESRECVADSNSVLLTLLNGGPLTLACLE